MVLFKNYKSEFQKFKIHQTNIITHAKIIIVRVRVIVIFIVIVVVVAVVGGGSTVSLDGL